MASNERWGPCMWEAICRICARDRSHWFTREQINAERHTIQDCAKAHGEYPEVTVSFTLTEFIKSGIIFRTDRGEYHLTDLGKANFRAFEKIEAIKRGGRSPSEQELHEIYDEEWHEQMKRWGSRFLKSILPGC